MTSLPALPTAPPEARTLGELRASGHVHRPVKAEIRANLVARLAAGEPAFPGIVGFDETVVPALERALLAGHDVVLLGERGQGKTRLIRTLIGLLDEWAPVVAGSEINDHPYAPVSRRSARLAEELGDDLPIEWKHRSERYGEKLATPDTTVGDLIGDVDPIKVAEGRTLGDPETVHFGLVPRTNRGILGINELPDLAERIQVSLLNVLEERDIQIRGYLLRLPLDVLLVASANPEDYTNRGRIITPLKDRFGTEVRTHYPLKLDDELTLLRQEARLTWPSEKGADGTGCTDGAAGDAGERDLGTPVIPDHLAEITARYTRAVRESTHIDHRSGVSARFAMAALETVAASAVRRAALSGEAEPVARVCDLPSVVAASRGKVEFADASVGSDPDEDDRETEILAHLLRRSIADTFRAHLAGVDLSGLLERFDEGVVVESGDLVPAAELLAQIGRVPGLSTILNRLGVPDGAESPGLAASAVELALEGLHLSRRLAKDSQDGKAIYGA